MRHVASSSLLVVVLLEACSPSAGTDAVDTQPDQHSVGVLFVERQGSGSGPSAHVGARFVQYTGIADEVVPNLLSIPSVPGATGCAARVDPALDTTAAGVEARLLDLGAIEVRADERTLRLEPRRWPDLWTVVSGVAYGTDGDLAATQWRFRAPGSATTHVGSFDVEARAPEELAGVTLAEQPLTGGAAVTLPHRPYALRWSRGERGDQVVLSFESRAGSPGGITCVAPDDGVLDLDAAWVDRVAELGRNGLTVTVHRVRTRPFAIAQIDEARVIFDLSIRAAATID